MTDGAISFLLACYKQSYGERAATTYSGDPLQHAVWDWFCQGGNTVLAAAAAAFDKYHEDSEYRPNVDTKPDDNVGTTIDNAGATYTVGPFKMSNYVRAEDYSYNVTAYDNSVYINDSSSYGDYDSNADERYNLNVNKGEVTLQSDFDNGTLAPGDTDAKGTIIKAEAVVTNEAGDMKKIEFPVPEPGTEYNITFSASEIEGYDELVDIIFTYQKVHSCGAGTWYDGQQKALFFEDLSTSTCTGCTTYYCQGGHNIEYPSDYNGMYYEGYYNGLYYYGRYENGVWHRTGVQGQTYCSYYYYYYSKNLQCGQSEHTHTRSCYENGCGKSQHTHSSSCYKKYYSNTEYGVEQFRCEHDHLDCKYFKWTKPTIDGDYAQDGFAGGGLLTTEKVEYKVRVAVPLKTQMSIYKYITSVDHVGETGNIFSGDERREWTMEEKYNKPVKVERGDLVTYTIELVNKSRFETRVKVKDILPENCEPLYTSLVDCTLEEMPNCIKFSEWINVPAKDASGESKVTFIIKVRPTQPEGIYTNIIEFITTNTSSEHMQFVKWGTGNSGEGKAASHGPNTNGSIVNTKIENGVTYTTDLKEKDSDTYEIKQYNVNIDKYIYDVNHVPDNVEPSKLDTSIAVKEEKKEIEYSTKIEEDERSVVKGMTEATKQANPVYVEYGDTVTYKINIYNTTNKYNSSIDRTAAPYWEPDKVYVNIEDTLPQKYKDLTITVSNGTGAITSTESSTSGGKFTINNIMVPPDDITTVTVTLVVDEHTKGTVETNSVKFIGEMRNINKGPGNENNVDDKFCVIKNNPITTETKDYYKLNNYNAFIDKYVSEYDEKVQNENNSSVLTNEDTITNDDGTLKTSRRNDSTQTSTISDGNVNDTVREPNGKDEYKEEHPVSVEKDENLVYHIKVSNEATTVTKSVASGTKSATQVRTTKVTDKMQLGLQQKRVTAKMYNADGTICNRYTADGSVSVSVSNKGITTENGRQYTVYEYTIGNETILNPGEYIIYSVEVLITGTDMYLYNLENTATLTILTNINNATDTYEVQTPNYTENISKQQETTEYVRLKDLVIAGKVWLDFNKNGLMDDTIKAYMDQANSESFLTTTDGASKIAKYHNINDDAMMKDIVVKLYKSDNETTPVRITKTDENGLFTFGRDENLSWYESGYNHDKQYSSSTTYQRIDKATGKDENGNYTENSQYIDYYVEYEYDGVIYKATAYSGKDHLNDDGSYKGAECNHPFETNTDQYSKNDYKKETAPDPNTEKYKYEYDSNANEFVSVRENFNTKYEYITYNKAYTVSGGSESGSDLDFDKTEHTSQLIVNHERKMTARSFIEEITTPNTQEATDYIPLFDYDPSNVTIPYSRYLKFINLGLELREDVDISLTKDVYKVKTTIKGEEMEYNFNENYIINGKVLDENEPDNYMLDKPYGIELYESDYKFRKEQYLENAVETYFGDTSELNTEVTYRIRVDHNKANKDDDLMDNVKEVDGYDSKNFKDTEKTELYVKIDEILDLYDENFIEYTQTMENGTEKDYILARQIDPQTGRFKKSGDDEYEDKEIKIAEAWYYKLNSSGNYILDESTGIYIDTTTDDVTIPDGADRYEKVPLQVSNSAKKGSTNEYINSTGYTADGYHKLYISGMGNEKIEEDKHLDIFVKYVLKKDKEEITVTNESWDETVTEKAEEIFDITVNDDGSYTWTYSSGSEGSSSTTTTLKRSLVIEEKTNTAMKQAYGLATENIAQVNLYSVWYKESDKPASLVDKDSNVGNVGMKDTINKVIDSVDNKKIYEDTIYKTGIDIVAEGTLNTREGKDWKPIKDSGSGVSDIMRYINGHVWDDSRSENSGGQYIGNGIMKSGTVLPEAKMNDLVPIVLDSKTEENDIFVPSAKVEFIEIVETAKDTYYEITPTNISSDYKQHVRTNTDGEYELYGYTPGKYIVRFTYGDDIEQNRDNGIVEQTMDKMQANQDDMYLFNGQDYKSTQYTTPNVDENGNQIKTVDDKGKENTEILSDDVILYNNENKTDSTEILRSNQAKIDKIIYALEQEDFNDARDDEIRRLEVNGYSEIMNNMIAEILQGMANGKKKSNNEYVTNNTDPNTTTELKALVDNTWMFAETIPFTVRAEKIDNDLKSKIASLTQNATYGNRQQLEKELTGVRTFSIDNVDFGIEYRPENAIQLEKDIKEVKIVTESNETVVDLHFYTEYKDLASTNEDESVKIHHLDTEKSVGLDMIQFISNDYKVNDLASKLITENEAQLQGFVYINYDTDIQQGATIEITYEYIAENHGEIDRISKNLDDIRYQNNDAVSRINNIASATGTDSPVGSNNINGNTTNNGITNYRANITAANDTINNMWSKDSNGDEYRTSPKMLIQKDNVRETTDTGGAPGEVSRRRVSYYGYYEGSTYYTGEDKYEFDTIAELKFNKILDYVDKDMVYLGNTTGEDTINRHWSVLNNIYGEYYSTIGWARSDIDYIAALGKVEKADIEEYINANINALNISSMYKDIENTNNLIAKPTVNTTISTIQGASIDPEGYRYENMLLSTDTGMYTDAYSSKADVNTPGTNPSVSRFLLPMVADTDNDFGNSRGKIQLTVSKAISAETNDDELEYENIGEIVEFTTLTGRRTNFATTIGNVDLRKLDLPDSNSDEYEESTPEPDQSATEVVTLIPPQGLMKRDRVIRNVVEVAKTGTQVVVIIVAVVAIVVFVTMFAIKKYNKRRIK